MSRTPGQVFIGLALACYPRRFRARFGAQIQADMEDERMERQSLSRWRRVILAMGDAWDILKGMARAHLHEAKQTQAVLAVAGGGPRGLRISNALDWKSIARQLPPMLGLSYTLMAGGIALGFCVYDYGQYSLAGIFGMTTFALCAPRIVAWASIHTKQQEPVHQATTRFMMLVIMLSFVAISMIGFQYVSEQARAIQASFGVGAVDAYRGVVGIPDDFLFQLVLATFMGWFWIMILGAGRKTQYLLAIISALFLVAILDGMHETKEVMYSWWIASWLVAQGIAILASHSRLFNVHKAQIMCGGAIVGLGSFLILLGFLLALSLDLSQSHGAANTPTIRDQATAYNQALDRVKAGGEPQVFWNHMETIKQQREAWNAHKPWFKLLEAKPIGITAIRWCQVQAVGRNVSPADCGNLPDVDRWITAGQARGEGAAGNARH